MRSQFNKSSLDLAGVWFQSISLIKKIRVASTHESGHFGLRSLFQLFFCPVYWNIQYRSKVWTHFFSFFKTAVEIGPVG